MESYSGELVRLYDLEHAGFDADVELYRSYALATPGPVLELGCGTGRLLRHLVGGELVVGVDISPEMLRAAHERLSAVRGAWQLVQADMTDLSSLSAGSFGLVICALNTWAYLTDPDAVLLALSEVRRVMSASGRLILDLEDAAHRPAGRGEVLLSAALRDDDAVVMKFTSTVTDVAAGVGEVTVYWDSIVHGSVRRDHAVHRLKLYTREELRQVLARGGFEVEEWLGGWAFEPYTASGDRLIAVARTA